MNDELALAQWQEFMSVYPRQSKAMGIMQSLLGYTFKNVAYMYEALTHRSAIVESKAKRKRLGKCDLDRLRWNERIEFLGDSILGLSISKQLWLNPLASDEGRLSKLRASLVCEASLAEIGRSIKLENCIILGRGEEKSGGRERDALVADTLEAIFGAVFLDGGVEKASDVISVLYEPVFKKGIECLLHNDYKTMLQEITQSKFKVAPSYHIVLEAGPDHSKSFTAECRLRERVIGVGEGHSKKISSQNAAKSAFVSYKLGKDTSWEKFLES